MTPGVALCKLEGFERISPLIPKSVGYSRGDGKSWFIVEMPGETHHNA